MLTGPQYIPTNKVNSAIVFLHGFGADGSDLIGLSEFLKDDFPDMAFFAPNGPGKTPFGYGHQWFKDMDFTFRDRTGIEVAKELLEQYLDESVAKPLDIKCDQIILVGFSQGTMTTLFAAPRLKSPVNAIIGLSGLMMWDEELNEKDIHKTPTLLIHGEQDEVVPVKESTLAAERLKNLGIDVELHLLDQLGHGIDERAIELIKVFARKHLS